MSVSTHAYKLFKELSRNDMLIESSATIDWENGLFEQQWKLQNKSQNPLYRGLLNTHTYVPNVLDEECIVFPSGQHIEVLSKEDHRLKIDLTKMKHVDKWQTVTIRFKSPFDKQLLYRNLCENNVNRIPEFIAKDTYAFTFSVMLNRADLLMNDFKYVFYTNIVLPFDIGIDKKIIEEALPTSFREKLISVSRFALSERKDALQHMSTLNQRILNLQQQEIKNKLPSFVCIDSPHGNANIRSIKCRVNPYLIGDGYRLSLPDSFRVELVCSINAREQAIKGKVTFDLNELKKFIAKTLSQLYEDSSTIRSP